MQDPSKQLTIEEATRAIGVARQTVYAYASRGLVRAIADPANPKRSLYDRHDVELLVERSRRGRSRSAVAAATLSWGEPVLASRITRIKDSRLYYRGKDAIALSQSASAEEVAALLWDCSQPPKIRWTAREARNGGRAAMQRCIERMARLASMGPWSAREQATLPAAVRIVGEIAGAAANAPALPRCEMPLHESLSHAWTGSSAAADAIRRALVLSADHELNASTYAVRVVASTRAPLGSCLLAGLAALGGPLHGGMTELVRALLSDAAVLAEPAAAIGARLARGESVPGFGHRLYPDGDPRASAILAVLPLPASWQRIVAAAGSLTGKRPNLDFALVAIEHTFKLPPDAAFALFAVGRSMGWIAHALEQRGDGTLIRPRAAYAGQ